MEDLWLVAILQGEKSEFAFFNQPDQHSAAIGRLSAGGCSRVKAAKSEMHYSHKHPSYLSKVGTRGIDSHRPEADRGCRHLFSKERLRSSNKIVGCAGIRSRPTGGITHNNSRRRYDI